MSEAVTALANRLKAVDWNGDWTRTYSRVALIGEYMRRSARWADWLSSRDWPFFDVATLIDPQVRADPAIVHQVEESFDRPGIWPTVRRTCVWALHFAALRDAKIPLPDLSDPFEPLVLMYERGGGFVFSEAGAIDVDGVGVQRGRMKAHLDSPHRIPLDVSFLDTLDREERTF